MRKIIIGIEMELNYINKQFNKALLIAEALYLRYLLLFLFDNAISHLVYAKDLFQV